MDTYILAPLGASWAEASIIIPAGLHFEECRKWIHHSLQQEHCASVLPCLWKIGTLIVVRQQLVEDGWIRPFFVSNLVCFYSVFCYLFAVCNHITFGVISAMFCTYPYFRVIQRVDLPCTSFGRPGDPTSRFQNWPLLTNIFTMHWIPTGQSRPQQLVRRRQPSLWTPSSWR